MDRPLSLDPFASQTRLQHLATVVGGILVCLLAYFGAVWLVYGDLAVVAVEANVGEQRVGGIAAGVTVWAYFGLAFVRGYGGPVLNTLLYPFLIALVAPHPARWILFGPDVSGLRERFVGLFVVEPVITAGLIVLPGFGIYTAILIVWAGFLDEEGRNAWAKEHLTPAFYDAFFDVE